MVFMQSMWEHENVFWDCQRHDLTLWESLLLVCSLSILWHKAYELVQLKVSQFLAQSLKQLELKPRPKPQSFENVHLEFSNCHFQTKISNAFSVFLPPLLNFVVIEHILPHLP